MCGMHVHHSYRKHKWREIKISYVKWKKTFANGSGVWQPLSAAKLIEKKNKMNWIKEEWMEIDNYVYKKVHYH